MRAQTAPPSPCRSGVSLASLAYYGIGGTAAWVVTPRSAAELAGALLWAEDEGLPVALFGKGSNILFSDEPFPGVVLTLERLSALTPLGEGRYWCEAGAANAALATLLQLDGRTGGEWLEGLPGSIGGTVRMNARCFGGEVSEVVAGVQVLTAEGHLLWRTAEELFLGYKETSLMQSREIVVAALMHFPHTDSREAIAARMAELRAERERKHHFDFPSCGSTFKNNYAAGRSSGMIFEELGFKGARQGGAAVSEHHANFIYNLGDASATDVLSLAARMRREALERADTTLDLEVECIGRFDRELLDRCGVCSLPDASDPSKGWAGLLRPPAVGGSSTPNSFPLRLLDGPFAGYGHAPGVPEGCFVQVEQLQSLSKALVEPRAPFLRWTSRFEHAWRCTPHPPSSIAPGSFVDGLWQYGVSELFIGKGDGEGGYLEFEVTPDGHWLALAFDAPRVRADGHQSPSPVRWIGHVELDRLERSVSLTLSLELLRHCLSDGCLRLQCAASAGNGRLGLLPGWNDPPDPPDFHRPGRFMPFRLS